MHFMLSSMSVVYVLTTPMPEDGGENTTVEQVRKRAKWDNDDYNVETSKELWDTLEAKYMAEDASSKKFLVSNFTNYKMTDSRPVLEQYNELLRILGRFTQHKMNMDEYIQEELTLIELGSHLRIEESLRVQDNDKPKGNNVAGPSVVNMVEHNNSSRYNDNKGKRKHHDTRANPNKKPKVTCWKYGKLGHLKKDCKAGNVGNRANKSSIKRSEDGSSNPLKGQNAGSRPMSHLMMDLFFTWEISQQPLCMDVVVLGHVYFKRMQDMSKDGLIPAMDMNIEKCNTCMLTKITKKPFQNVKHETKVLEQIDSDLYDLHATPSLGTKKYFVTFIDDASRAESRVLGAVVRLPYPKLKTLGERGIECIFVGYTEHSKAFRFYVIKPNDSVAINSIIESRDAIFDDHRKLKVDGTVENFKAVLMDVKIAFLNGELDEEVYMNQPKGFIMLGNKNKVDLNKELLSSRFSMKDMGEADVIMGIRIKHESNGIAISQSHYIEKYSRVIGCLMYAMTYTRLDIAFDVGKPSRLLYTGYPSMLKGYTDASWISNTEENSSTSGWVFLLGGVVISWASKKQTSITGSPIEYEFVALAAAGKEAKWLKNLLLEIPLLVKPLAHISIHYDSAATLAKSYSQMYNRKSRHLCVRHSMIRKLITNGVVSIDFVRSQQNLANHLTKGLARDLVIKSAEGMGLKSN
ncbi:zinc finger, CCHC-type containing protein [Tanacetum coccineum]